MATSRGSKAKQSSDNKGRAVVVTSAHRGVFFGYLLGEPSKEQVKLRACRNVVSWDAATKGFLGMASTGPTNGCRIGPAAGDESTIYDITGVFGCTDAATARFEAGPWA
jgi:hypothetical protein